LVGSNVTQQIGQEMVGRAYNAGGDTISNGDVVYFWSTASEVVACRKFIADGTIDSSLVLGLATEDIAAGEYGYITEFGLVRDLDTATFNAGDIIYASAVTTGSITNIRPSSPNKVVILGICLQSDSTNGILLVKPHDVPEATEIRYDNSDSELVATNDGTETLITTSNISEYITSTTYVQINLSATISLQTFTDTDQVVIKLYGETDSSTATYELQLGGSSPFRSLFPVPVSVVPAVASAFAIVADTTNFDGKLSSADDTVQKALETLDDHVHQASEITGLSASNTTTTTTGFDGLLSAADDDVQKALNTLDDVGLDDVTGVGATTTNAVTINASLDVDNIKIDGNAITSTDLNGNIALTPSGTGEVDISKVDIDGGVIDGTTIGGTTPDAGTFTGLTVNSTATFAGATISDLGTVTTADIDGGTIDGVDLSATVADIDNIRIDGNDITSTDGNGNINLTPNGLGEVNISKVDIDAGAIDGTTIGSTASGDKINGGIISAFQSQGIDDNATSTQLTISNTSATFSGDLTVDTNTLHVDSTNNRVGVATDSPTVAFEVANALRASSTRLIVDSGNGGTEAAPALVFDGDADSGIFHPLSNTLGFSTFGSERMRIDSNGNVGIGSGSTALSSNLEIHDSTTGDAAYLNVYNTGGGAVNDETSIQFQHGVARRTSRVSSTLLSSTQTALTFSTEDSGTVAERMRIDASGNVGIGREKVIGAGLGFAGDTTSAGAGNIKLYDEATGALVIDGFSAGFLPNSGIQFRGNGTERMRIDSSGNLLVGTTSAVGVSKFAAASDSSITTSEYYRETTTATIAISNWYSDVVSTAGLVAQMRCNGGLRNYQSNDIDLSDERSKKDFKESKDYLSTLCHIPVKTFRYKHETENDPLHLGVIAQDVEKVAPEFVDSNSWEYEGQSLNSVRNKDIMFAMLKAIQEQQEIIEELRARVATLEAGA